MHSNKPLFSPEPSSAGEYVMVVLTLLNNFHKTLRERQSRCLNKVQWGQPVIPGKHASFTIDRKHRGTTNVYDTDPNAPDSADEAEVCELPQTEATSCRNEDSDVVDVHPKLVESEQVENSMPTSEPNVLVQTEEPLKSVAPSISESSSHSNHEENPNWKSKRQKLCKKLSNKENHKQKVKLHCLQRRSLFRKCQSGGSPVLPSSHETQELNANQASLSNILSPGVMATSLDTNLAECLEENIYSCDPLSIVAVSSVSKESPLSGKLSSPPRTPNWENDKASPLRESKPSNSCDEILSCSPVFAAYESPFRNSELASHLKENSMAKVEESPGSVGSLINAKEMSSEQDSKTHPRLLESKDQDSVGEQKNRNRKLKMAIPKTLPKQKSMVQCPLCCDWFKPKVIERHAANCGIIAPIQFDGGGCGGDSDAQLNSSSVTSVPNEHQVQKEICNLNPPSESENSKPDPTRNGKLSDTLENETAEETAVQNFECSFPIDNNSKEETPQHLPSLDDFVLEPVEKSVITFENNKTRHPKTVCVLPEISDLIPILKRCFICDLSYADGKPFSTHLRTCRKKYQKLKRQFSGFSEECEEPQRKTRSRSVNVNNGDTDAGENLNSNLNT